MQGSALIVRYRSYAAKCLAISRNVRDPPARLVLLEMAQSWLKLAEEAAERTKTVVNETAARQASQRD